MFCLRASQIWSGLICGRKLQMLCLDRYLFESCLCEGLLDLSPFKVYKDRAVEPVVKANLLGMTAFVSDWKKWTVCWR